MKVLIIEDEILAAENLVSALSALDQNIEVMSVLESVDESLEWFENNPSPDLIFSDIHLADGLCFKIYEAVQIESPIVFTTAYDKYAIQAFELNSLDYLLKPIDRERLSKALDKFKSTQEKGKQDLSQLMSHFETWYAGMKNQFKSRFLCKLGNKIKSVPIEEIKYFYSQDKVSFIVDTHNKRYPINNTLDQIEGLIDPEQFFRLNRKFISHFSAISEIHPYFKGRLKVKLTPAVDDDIVISSEKSPIFKSWLDR